MQNQFQTPDALTGTLSGTMLVLLAGISPADILKTCLLAAIGAMVSFGVSLLLNWLMGKCRKKNNQ